MGRAQAEWSRGSELQWALIGYLEECFSALVLLIAPGSLTQTQPQGELEVSLSELPREVLLRWSVTGGELEVLGLQTQLLQAQVSG